MLIAKVIVEFIDIEEGRIIANGGINDVRVVGQHESLSKIAGQMASNILHRTFEEEQSFKVVCSSCKTWLSGPPFSQKITHGICKVCKEKELKKIKESHAES